MAEDKDDYHCYQEYVECDSEYLVSAKESSDEISSDGEFLDANKMLVFNEDDSIINYLEKKKDEKTQILN